MLDEYKKVRKIFKRPKAHIFFGFWTTPTWINNLEKWLINNMNNEKTFKYRIANFIDKIFGRWANPCLPMWRRGNSIRLFRKHQVYMYDQEHRGYVWTDEFKKKLEKFHLSWLKPEYELPIWLSFYVFNFDMMWKWKYDDVRYEFPPQFTIVFFGLSFSIYWNQPKTNDGGDDTMYWETILNYTYKYRDTLKSKPVDMLSQIIGLSDYCGYWNSYDKDDNKLYIWNVQPDYLRNKEFARILKEHQQMKEVELREKYESLKCPKCGSKVKLDEGMMMLTLPPLYQYTCPKCGEKKYLEKEIKDEEVW